jgi:integrase
LALAAGLDPARFGGHSLRAGFVTQAYRDGATDAEIMGTTRHKSTAMLARYRREADPVARGATPRIKV